MRRGMTRRGWVVLVAGLGALVFCLPAMGESDEGLSPCEVLAGRIVQLRDEGIVTLSPLEAGRAGDVIAEELTALIESSGGAPAKSEGQRLLALVYDFEGKTPESVSAYGAYLDTLESWQGRDYAVMAARRMGDGLLENSHDASKALRYYDLLLSKYPSHASRAHVWYQSGLACIELKAYADAVERFDAAYAEDAAGYYGAWSLRKKAYALSEIADATEGNYGAGRD